VADWYARLLAAKTNNCVVNLCSSRLISIREILSELADIAGYEINVSVNPEFVRAREIRALRGDNSRLKSICGTLQPKEMRDTLQWMFLNRVGS
jgi:GDP-6-deoxy-D-talose 4-dehydrogenase